MSNIYDYSLHVKTMYFIFRAEKLKAGGMHTYLVAVPVAAENIEKVTLDFSKKRFFKKPGTWLGSPDIYVDYVALEPMYIDDPM